MEVTDKCFLSRLLCATAVFSAAIGVSGLAAADEEDEQAAAREHYSKGKELYEVGDYARALEEFQAAYDAKPHPTVLKSVAECQVQTKDLAGAIATFEKYLANPDAPNKPTVEARLLELKKMMGQVEVTSEPPGAGIVLDGNVTGEVTPVTLDIAPGDHEVVLNAEGYEPLVKPLSVESGAKTQLAADFATEGDPVEPAAQAGAGPGLVDPFADEGGEGAGEEPPPEPAEEDDGPPPAFWVSAAVAGVGLVSGTVFGTMALGDEEDYKKNPTKNIKDRGETNAIIADVSFGLAAAAAVVGAVILITDDGGEAEVSTADSRWQVVPVATDESVGVSTAVKF